MSTQVAKESVSLISGNQITPLQLAEEIKTLLQVSRVKQIEIVLQENSSTWYLLRVDLVKRVIEANSHLPEKIIIALNQAFGDSLTIHVKPEKVNEHIFGESNKNLLFNNQPLHNQTQKNSDKKGNDEGNLQLPSRKKF